MSYIIKNTAGLINTRITDVGRRKISQGNFNIKYFQVGDSEVKYGIPNYNQTNNNILMPSFNQQNNTGAPGSNKQSVKYPFYVNGNSGGFYGIPFDDSQVQDVYNSVPTKGFFTAGAGGTFTLQTGSGYTVGGYTTIGGSNTLTLTADGCGGTGLPQIGDFVTLLYGGSCNTVPTGQILQFRVLNAAGTTIEIDRVAPAGAAKVVIYPSGMTQMYDQTTPALFWNPDTLNFTTDCTTAQLADPPVWNMNIPWSESPAGLQNSLFKDYTMFGSVSYLGTKEYMGYQTNSGQTDTSSTYYYNSLLEKINLSPSDQKAIAIIHYTNQTIDFVYGEKFATVPFDPLNPVVAIGQARNFQLAMPTLAWHKSTTGTVGQTFYIDPPGFSGFETNYIQSIPNQDMNDPGIRYHHLWDINPDLNGNINRVGKVFPDQQIVIIDDEEIVAALSYKSNRNWTLAAPSAALSLPLTGLGLMQSPDEILYVSYLIEDGVTDYLHSNYYAKVLGPQTGCTTSTQDVLVKFGPEFPFFGSVVNPTAMSLLVQRVTGDTRPDPILWKQIDVTSQVGSFTSSGIAAATFRVDQATYNAAPTYVLSPNLTVPIGSTAMNFGDEYFFYGNLTTDIQATIYEMRYLINLSRNQFVYSSNPSWLSGTTAYVTEIGLFDDDDDLLVISKLQSPQIRQGVQQYLVKIDF